MNYFEFSTDNSTWVTDLPQPSSLNGDGEDIDNTSYRDVIKGNIHRSIIGYKWQKISFSWNYLDETTASTLMSTVRTANNIYIRTKSPLLSSGGYVTLKGYISKLHFELVKASNADGYKISFDFVEGYR